MKHNTTIIEALIGCTLLVTLFVAIRSFLVAKEPAVAGLSNVGDIEGTLKKILEQASRVPTAGSVAAAGASEDSQKLVAEIDQLKVDIEARQKTIEELKAAQTEGGVQASAGALSDQERGQLDLQLKELQAKLSEYEIISEDIADLSFYKEQNLKLSKELESFKGGATPSPAPVAQAKVDAAPEKPKEEPAIVGKSQMADPVLAEATVVEAVPEASAAVAASEDVQAETVANVVDTDLMAEFNAAVVKQQGSEPVDSQEAEVVPEAPVEEVSTVDLGSMDVDKMMAEAAAIKVDGPEVSAEQALGVGLDENKLLQEATALQAVTPEDKKLMGQFENFVKKSE